MLLLNPIIARRGVDGRVIPIPGIFELVSIVGALAFIFGLGLFAGTILLTSSSRRRHIGVIMTVVIVGMVNLLVLAGVALSLSRRV